MLTAKTLKPMKSVTKIAITKPGVGAEPGSMAETRSVTVNNTRRPRGVETAAPLRDEDQARRTTSRRDTLTSPHSELEPVTNNRTEAFSDGVFAIAEDCSNSLGSLNVLAGYPVRWTWRSRRTKSDSCAGQQ